MNLEQFLLYIHNGAYHVAKQLLGQELSIADLKQLRLVSRATNNVVLEYPILTTLYISTLPLDLDYLEVVSKNDRLLRHVSTLWWDHSTFWIILLAPNDLVKDRLEYMTDIERMVGITVPLQVWEAEASDQWHNLKDNRDYALLTRMLPFLRNVHSVIFTTNSFEGDNLVAKTPAITEYEALYSEYPSPPIVFNWDLVDGTYYPDAKRSFDLELFKELHAYRLKGELWEYLPARGIKFFHHSLTQALSKENLNQKMDLHSLFPKLKSIFLHNFPADYITLWGGGPIHQVLEGSAAGLQELNLFLTESEERFDPQVDYCEDIKSLAEISSFSLQSLTVEIDNFIDDPKHCEVFMPIMIGLLPQLFALSHVRLSLFLQTTVEEMATFGKAIRACRSMRKLELDRLYLRDEIWDDVLVQWKQSKNLHHLDKIIFESFCCWLDHDYHHSSRSESAIVDWLHGRTKQYPLKLP